jgi:hypothetical protein
MKIIEIIYIGGNFYSDSGSSMSCIYGLDGKRWDWGFVEIALQNGTTFHIRPATEAEKHPYFEKLMKLIKAKQFSKN